MPRKDIDIEVPNLIGRRVVLTGGSDGIGLGIAKRLAAAGAELLLPVRNQARARLRSQRSELRRRVPRWCCMTSTCRRWTRPRRRVGHLQQPVPPRRRPHQPARRPA